MKGTTPIDVESQLLSELERLKSRLAQGQRDHQRSHDELQKLEADIRSTEGELRTHRRENLPSTFTEAQLAGACDAVVSALRAGRNPQSHVQLSVASHLEVRLVVLAATRLTREGRVTIESHHKQPELVWLV